MSALAVAGVMALLSGIFLIHRDYHFIVVIAVIAGWLQAPLISWTHSTSFQYIDDVPVVILVVAAVLTALVGERKNQRAFLLYGILVVLAALAYVRSPDRGVGLEQARQVLLPLGLVLAGYVFRETIKWSVILWWVVVMSLITAAWVIVEKIQTAPLIDPVFYALEAVGANPALFRHGLPSAYYADGIGSGIVFRSGGPFMNAPTAGFFLGLGAIATMLVVKSREARLLLLAVFAAGLYCSYARAGFLLIGVMVLYIFWARAGKFLSGIVGIAVAAYVVEEFLAQGNTASHADGLTSGLTAGATSPLGQGFGLTGYQSVGGDMSVGTGSESLIGLYATWLGVSAVIALVLFLRQAWRTIKRTPRNQTLPMWAALGFIAAAAASESASALSATVVLWMLVGRFLGTPIPEQSAGGVDGDDEPRLKGPRQRR